MMQWPEGAKGACLEVMAERTTGLMAYTDEKKMAVMQYFSTNLGCLETNYNSRRSLSGNLSLATLGFRQVISLPNPRVPNTISEDTT